MIDELKYIIKGEDFCTDNGIIVHNPTLEEMSNYGEEKYLTEVSTVVLRPYDAAVMLDDAGIDYSRISDYELFLMISRTSLQGCSLLFPNLDFSELKLGINPENELPLMYDPSRKFIIDELIYKQIVDYVRSIHFIRAELEYDAGNARMRRSLIDKKRREMKKNKNKAFESQYPSLISALVNNKNFKYDYSTVFSLKVSQFWDAFYRVNKMQSYSNTMLGVYTGNINASKLNADVLQWFSRIDINAAPDKPSEDKILTATTPRDIF